MRLFRAIGLMSGTSMDGVDVALIETDGESEVRLGPFLCRSYSDMDRAVLRQALEDARSIADRHERPGALAGAERIITERHAAAVQSFLRINAIDPGSIDIIGFHGQTVLHRPQSRLTVQIGDGRELARRLGIPVAFDFRAPDVAAGGHGAPLVPVFHRALAEAARMELPAVILNLGGVANLTYLAERGADPLAWDTGPGNALLDDLMLTRTGAAMDRDGRIAASGTVNEGALHQLLAHVYFDLPPPKSLDRNAFSLAMIEHSPLADAKLMRIEKPFSARPTRRTTHFFRLWAGGVAGVEIPLRRQSSSPLLRSSFMASAELPVIPIPTLLRNRS